jgi:hypothetical protein
MSETAGEAAKLTIQDLVDANHIPFDQGVVTVSGMSACAILIGPIAFCSPEAWHRRLSPKRTCWSSI